MERREFFRLFKEHGKDWSKISKKLVTGSEKARKNKGTRLVYKYSKLTSDFIQLAKEHGRDFKLIAEKLGISEKTARYRAAYIVGELRKGRIPMD